MYFLVISKDPRNGAIERIYEGLLLVENLSSQIRGVLENGEFVVVENKMEDIDCGER
ncbi:hypothetical protein BDF14DRAFT_1995846 [Spinellus fusiger]|nr:hypothetical protein BDF14DRAFT_1995846 [Spinellus fusiger]